MHPKPKLLSLIIAGMLLPAAATAQQAGDAAGARSSEVGTIAIAGDGDKLGTGLIDQEDTPKARSSVARSSIDKARATADPFQLIELLPGVNTYSQDATGLFGGGLSIRGFNGDQIGLTVNGAPINDSGNYSVFPQEYMDQENLCQVFVTQGSTDTDAPHVGASGGNLGIVTCDPQDVRRLRLTQTLGQDRLYKTFVRADSGLLFDGRFKGFLSISKSEVDKWKGRGGADRTHIDAGAELALAPGSRLAFSALYNRAMNHNYKTLSKAQYEAFGGNFEFLESYGGNPAPVTGTAQTAVFAATSGTAPVTPQNNAYYNLSQNPVRNGLFTVKGNFQLQPNLRLDLEPYYWYSYATGGTQQKTLSESGFYNPASGKNDGRADINGDGDTLDTVLVYGRNVSTTHRPGATVRLNYQLDSHKLVAGFWYERARHYQASPAVRVDANGNPLDPWLEQGYILRPDGSAYQARRQMTINTSQELFLQDSFSLLNDKLRIDLGVRRPSVTRDFNNYANESAGMDYQVSQSFSDTLPSLGVRYQLNPVNQVFFSVAKNFKAPSNAAYQNLVDASGQVRVPQPRAETAINTDLGFRSQGTDFTFSGTLFRVVLSDRQATAYDVQTGNVDAVNVGKVKLNGLELEAGTRPYFGGWSAYGSYTYTDSRTQDDLRSGVATYLPTAGKVFPNTPAHMFGASLQYAAGPFYAQLQAKYTGRLYSTLTNDEETPGRTVVNLNLGYRLPDTWLVRNQTLRLNVSNLFDRKYLILNAGTGDAVSTNASGPGAVAPSYFVGAPRFVSVAYSVDF